ncbi:hypothetical protein M7I_0998 [Glarea lozoyensis 74030]|uniref:Uncharacterized protein n=1 Tax=Glarea lozoyensis (strain ATCC 74030 / MF5533) TaxID=1104152 RepID=H0EEW3_GLAL7|nr:hypothetical protein M7I_0998 [Glarea lozoyensis 74030]
MELGLELLQQLRGKAQEEFALVYGGSTSCGTLAVQLLVHDITPHWVFVLTMFGQAIAMKGAFKRKKRPQDVEFAKKWFVRMQELLDGNYCVFNMPQTSFPRETTRLETSKITSFINSSIVCTFV